jgi:hypothetical protein
MPACCVAGSTGACSLKKTWLLQRFLEQKALQEVILLFLDASGRSLSKLAFIIQV